MTSHRTIKLDAVFPIDYLNELFAAEFETGKIVKKTVPNSILSYGGLTSRGYMRTTAKGTDGKTHMLLIHRIVFALYHGYYPEIIDHINRDKTDNRIENLRDASASVNSSNRDKFTVLGKTRTSKYHNVTKRSDTRYEVSLSIGEKSKHIGCFSTEKEAALQRDLAIYLHSDPENHILNFPELKGVYGILKGHLNNV